MWHGQTAGGAGRDGADGQQIRDYSRGGIKMRWEFRAMNGRCFALLALRSSASEVGVYSLGAHVSQDGKVSCGENPKGNLVG